MDGVGWIEEADRGPSPSFVVALVEGLPSGSMTVAMKRAGSNESEKYSDFLEWGRTENILADLFDVIQENTRVTGQFKKTPPPFPPYPGRPQVKKKATVKDLFRRFQQAGAPTRE